MLKYILPFVLPFTLYGQKPDTVKFHTYNSFAQMNGYAFKNVAVPDTGQYKNYIKQMRKEAKQYKKCSPCIAQYYTITDTLHYEAFVNKNCYTGWFKEYYQNGNVKVSGNYAPLSRTDKNCKYECPCNVINGQWVYFNAYGDTLYSEFWDMGNFIKQVPEQTTAEVWKMDILLDSISIYKNGYIPQKIDYTQLKDLKIVPYFKNSYGSMDSIKILVMVNDGLTKNYNETFNLNEFKKLDLPKVLIEKGFSGSNNLNSYGNIRYGKKYLAYFSIDLSRARLPLSSKPLFLKNTADSTKKIEIINKNVIQLCYAEHTSDSTLVRDKYVNGTIKSTSDSTIVFITESEEYHQWSEGKPYTVYTSYSNFSEADSTPIRTIKLRDLNSISVTHPTKFAFTTIGACITITSLVSTLFVAPLASINFKTREFNKDRYYKFAGLGLIGVSVGIPLCLITNHSRYNITSRKNGSIGKKYWYIE